ncbi:type IV pilus assembly protein PilM [Chloracidobacterium thermophilum]|uniref:Type IV pilus assembly protein PilM n=1 Tax=Chloracidobacterium thermophilum (strain B) TaxID=981222 RepID=G2LIR7_CHLTF|nr:type IV pilus assembly protein PilM [Chloracidobacterium thermophilum]AEP12285.1 type IV pilus assembly protein PilM [Chloracidobacterium thermophilum B]QUV78036.1 type IV pilus assembly protein PilM [Chloracidobacterium thermophilum]
MGLLGFGSAKTTVGIDIGSSAIKVVELQPVKNGTYKLLNIGHANLVPDAIVDGHIIDLNHVSDAIGRLLGEHKIKTKDVHTSVSGHSVIIKKIEVAYMTDDELAERIQWEADQHIPFDITDVNLDYSVVGRDPASGVMQVLLVACKRDKIAQYTTVISQAGRNPVVIDVDAFALQNAYEVNYQPMPTATVALLDIGAAVTSINIVRGSNSVFTRDISAGGNQYTDLLQKELGLTFEQAEALKRGVPTDNGLQPSDAQSLIDSVTDILAMEVQKTMDFWRATSSSDVAPIDRVLVAGGSSKISGLTSAFSERFGIPVERFNAFNPSRIKVDSGKFDEEYIREMSPTMAVAVGLAARQPGQ